MQHETEIAVQLETKDALEASEETSQDCLMQCVLTIG